MEIAQVGQYRIGRTVGKGNFATVKLAYHRVAKRKVAMKMVEKARIAEENLLKIHREIAILKALRHPHIIRLYEILEDDNLLFIATEYAGGGEIFTRLTESGPMGEPEARRVFAEIVSAVAYCHARGVVHRDLKAENILLDSKGSIKLIDFGFANYWSGEGLKTWCGSPPYAAPELFLGQAYDGAKADVWSLGVVLFILVSGGFPFPATSIERLKKAVLSGSFSIPFRVSVECSDLIRKMLTVNAHYRYTIRQVLQHRWFAVGDDIPMRTRELMQESLEPDSATFMDNRCEALNETVLLYLQQNAGWQDSAIRDSVGGLMYDAYHGAYSLLCEKLKRQSASSPNLLVGHGSHRALSKGGTQGLLASALPRRGSITQGTAGGGGGGLPISASDLAQLAVSSPDLVTPEDHTLRQDALSSEESDGGRDEPQEDHMERLQHLYQTGISQAPTDQACPFQQSAALASVPHNPNRRHTLCDAAPDQAGQAFLLAAAQITAGHVPTPPTPGSPFPLDSPLLPHHMASIVAAHNALLHSALNHPTNLNFAPPSGVYPGCFGGPSTSAGSGMSLLNPYEAQPWGRRASDNPGLTGDIIAQLQAHAATAESGGSEHHSPSTSTGGGEVEADDAQLQAYLRGRGSGKRHTIADAQSFLFSPMPANPYQLPTPPGVIPPPMQQLSPLGRERRRHDGSQPYKANIARRSSDNPGDINAQNLAHLQALFSQRLAQGETGEIQMVVAEMEKLKAANDQQRLGSPASSSPAEPWYPGSSPRATPNPFAGSASSSTHQLGSIQEAAEAFSPPPKGTQSQRPAFPAPNICITDTERGEDVARFIHSSPLAAPVIAFQTEAARLLAEAVVSADPADGDLSSAIATTRPIGELLGDLRLLATQHSLAITDCPGPVHSVRLGSGTVALEIRLASDGESTRLQFRRLQGDNGEFQQLSQALVSHLHL